MAKTPAKGPGDLNAKQARFAKEYLMDLNATQAAIRAGYSERTAEPWMGFYVYLLIDPRSEQVFYVGKGKGRRAHVHAAMVRCGRSDNGAKCARIAQILSAGLEVSILILEQGLTEDEAFALERELLTRLCDAGLTNMAGGVVTARESAMGRAAALRDTMLPYDTWTATAPRERLEQVRRVFGSTEAFYNWYSSRLEEWAVNPPPTEIEVRTA